MRNVVYIIIFHTSNRVHKLWFEILACQLWQPPEKLYSVLFYCSDGLHLRTLRPSVKQGKLKSIKIKAFNNFKEAWFNLLLEIPIKISEMQFMISYVQR